VSATTYARQRPIPRRKVELVREYASLLRKYDGVVIVSITGISAPVLHEVRAKLREEGDVLKVIKNTLMTKAIDAVSSEKRGLERLKDYLTGQNAAIFTDKNPFSLKMLLDKSKVMREARAGDVAQSDIVVREGNTNIAPGPIISLFNKLGVPVSIREGSVWVTRDTIVARKGDVISSDLAELLRRLGMKPIEVSLKVKAAYTDGIVIPGEELEIDLSEYEEMLKRCVQQAVNLCLNAAYPTAETVGHLVAKAHLEGLALSLSAAYFTPEAMPLLLAKAEREARAIYELVHAASAS